MMLLEELAGGDHVGVDRILRVFITLDDLCFVDFLAGCGIMRPKRDACRALGLIRVFAGAIAQGRALFELLFSSSIR